MITTFHSNHSLPFLKAAFSLLLHHKYAYNFRYSLTNIIFYRFFISLLFAFTMVFGYTGKSVTTKIMLFEEENEWIAHDSTNLLIIISFIELRSFSWTINKWLLSIDPLRINFAPYLNFEFLIYLPKIRNAVHRTEKRINLCTHVSKCLFNSRTPNSRPTFKHTLIRSGIYSQRFNCHSVRGV